MRVPLSVFADYFQDDRNLIGGRARGNNYLVVLLDGENIIAVYDAKLLNNRRSQKTPSHPDGYQPFLIGDEPWKYDIRTKALEIRRIVSWKSFTGKCHVCRELTKVAARILKIPPRNSEQFHLLETMRRRTWQEEQLRRMVSADFFNFQRLEIAADLLQESVLCVRGVSACSLIEPTHKRFEYYVRWASDEVLSALLCLLKTDLQRRDRTDHVAFVTCP
jgi:hypothetical protein